VEETGCLLLHKRISRCCVVIVSTNLLSDSLDGILGLGSQSGQSVTGTLVQTTTISNCKGSAAVMQNLWNYNVINQNMFGVQVIRERKPIQLQHGGKRTFGGYNTTFIRGSLSTAPLTRQGLREINVPTMRVSSIASYTLTSNVIVDTGTTLIFLSEIDCDHIYSSLPGVQYNITLTMAFTHFDVMLRRASIQADKMYTST